jgi:hypothetical protein
MKIMSNTRSGSAPDDGLAGTWSSESLPLAVRRQLLERELSKLGLRKSEAGRGGSSLEGNQHQQEGPSSHPQADDSSQHGD